MLTPVILGPARALLSAFGGILVALGYTDESTANVVVGAIVTIGTALWSVWEKLRAG